MLCSNLVCTGSTSFGDRSLEHGYWSLHGKQSIVLLLARNASDSIFWSVVEGTGGSPHPSNGWTIQADVCFLFICWLMFQNGHKSLKSLLWYSVRNILFVPPLSK